MSASSLAGSQAAGILETGVRPGSSASTRAGRRMPAIPPRLLPSTTSLAPPPWSRGNHGIYKTHLQRLPQPDLMPSVDLGKTWQLAGIALKPYPCCHFIPGLSTPGSTCATRWRSPTSNGSTAADQAVTPAGRRATRTPHQADDAVRGDVQRPYVVALALVKGKVDLASFHDLGIDDPDVLALAAKIYIHEDPQSDFPVHFRAKSGSRSRTARS